MFRSGKNKIYRKIWSKAKRWGLEQSLTNKDLDKFPVQTERIINSQIAIITNKWLCKSFKNIMCNFLEVNHLSGSPFFSEEFEKVSGSCLMARNIARDKRVRLDIL